MLRAAAVALAIATAVAQDSTPCGGYDINTGKGSCNGVDVDIGGVICMSGFDQSRCKATHTLADGRTETFYFKGTPSGLPTGPSIQSDCGIGDFPAGGNVAMAQTYKNTDGSVEGCYPAADVLGTTLTYTAGSAPNTVASVTVFFNIHTDGGGAQRDGFIKITCLAGGPKSGFTYSTVGDTGHSSQYEIDTTADCAAAGGGPSPAAGGGAAEGGETGWILVGLLFGFSAVYFGGFYVYNWKVKGAEAGERMPHKEFWFGLPDLVKTGFRFTLSKAKREEYTAL